MAQIALKDATIADSTAPNHITYSTQEYQGESAPYCVAWDMYGQCIQYRTDPVYGSVNKTTSATVKGKTATPTVTNVTIQGKAPIVQGDKTTENDTYTLPSGGVYVSGSHSNGQGTVSNGNNKNVYVNGKLLAVVGSNVTTHAGTTTTINGGGSSTVSIG